MIAGTIDSVNLASRQVDNSRHLIQGSFLRSIRCRYRSYVFPHAQSAPCTGTKDLHLLVVLHILWNINQDIAAVLHDITVTVTRTTLSGTIYLCYGIIRIILQEIRHRRAEIYEGIIHTRFGIDCRSRLPSITMFIKEISELQTRVVVSTITTGIDTCQMSLRIFGICRYLLGSIHTWKGQTSNLLTNSAGEIGLIKNTSTQVITTIYIVTNIRESLCERAVCIHLPTHVGLRMTKDICIT